MDKNEFEFDGKVYIQSCGQECDDCDLEDSDGCLHAPCGANIIFVEKNP